MKILVATYPFGSPNNKPLDILSRLQPDHELMFNHYQRKMSRQQHLEILIEYKPDIIIAGTERYDKEVLNQCPNLKLIARVGVGFDGIDLQECAKRNIRVTYTPDAPSNAVAELTICQMLNLLRDVQNVSTDMRNKKWNRYVGKDLRDCDVGIIGCGRIGKLVVDKLQGLKPRRIFANDLIIDKVEKLPRCEFASKTQVLINSDIVTIHIPLTPKNYNFISGSDFNFLKKDVILINTSRGGIINERDLYQWAKSSKAKISLDVFEEEPYTGELLNLPNVYPTPHLGSCTQMSRLNMEVGAVEEVINFLHNKDAINRLI